MPHHTNFQTEFDAALIEALERFLMGPDGLTPRSLQESIRYSLLAPSKKIRPRLLLSCAEMLGLQRTQVIPAAIAIEMIHCFTLIHDDLPCMDDDDFRRGQPSNHKKFGESIALLAGDALIPLAFDVFLETPVELSRLKTALKRLAWASGPRGVTGGQAAESDLSKESSIDQLRQMHRQKTGALFIASLLIPKDLAEIPDESPEGLSILSFADELGLAFQVADDLEDIEETSPETAPGAFHEARVQGAAHASSKTFQAKPTSVLFFMKPEQARQQTLERLTAANQRLASHWGDRARSLGQIAEEVIRKLQLSS